MAAQTPNQIPNATGNAPIIKVGHTTNSQFGSSVNAKPKGRNAATNLSIK